MMLKNIFFPIEINNYYIFPTKIVGLDITKDSINVTLIKAHGRTSTIIGIYKEVIESTNTNEEPQQLLQNTITKILSNIGDYDILHVALSGSLVVFRELELPFITTDQIALVIELEVESLLPFPISNAAIDFIITNQSKDTSTVLVGATQKSHITDLINMLDQINVQPNKIIIDIFGLYNFYKLIDTYKNQSLSSLLVDIGIHSTKLGYISDGKLRQVRTLPIGLMRITKEISQVTEKSPQQILLYLLNQEKNESLDIEQYNKQFKPLWDQIVFTIDSLAIPPQAEKLQALLCGEGATIHSIEKMFFKGTNIPCQLFDPSQIINNTSIKIDEKIQTIPLSNLLSTAISLPESSSSTSFLLKNFINKKKFDLFKKQLFSGGLILLFIVTIIATFIFINLHRINSIINTYKIDTIEKISTLFPKIDTSEPLEEIISVAEGQLKQEEAIWDKFSQKSKPSFLAILLELTDKIDRENLGLKIEFLSMNENFVELTGSVKNFATLKKFEAELHQSKILQIIPPAPLEPAFTIQLRIMNKRGDSL